MLGLPIKIKQVLNIASVVFMVVSLVAIVSFTNDPIKNQIVGIFAKGDQEKSGYSVNIKNRQIAKNQGSGQAGAPATGGEPTATNPNPAPNSAPAGLPVTTSNTTNNSNLPNSFEQKDAGVLQTVAQNPGANTAGTANAKLPNSFEQKGAGVTQTVTQNPKGNTTGLQPAAALPGAGTNIILPPAADKPTVPQPLGITPAQAQNAYSTAQQTINNPFAPVIDNLTKIFSAISGTKLPSVPVTQPQNLNQPLTGNPNSGNQGIPIAPDVSKPVLSIKGVNIPASNSSYTDTSGNRVNSVTGSREFIPPGATRDEISQASTKVILGKDGSIQHYDVPGNVGYVNSQTFDKNGKIVSFTEILATPPEAVAKLKSVYGNNTYTPPAITGRRLDYNNNKTTWFSYETNAQGKIIDGQVAVYNGPAINPVHKDNWSTFWENQATKATITLDNLLGIDYQVSTH